MKTHFDVIVVIPIGPDCVLEYIKDTIDSYMYYTRSSCKIILADDTQFETGMLFKRKYPQIDVVSNYKRQGKLCGLYITLSRAYIYALRHYSFNAILRMDSDALIIGEAPEKEALQLFANDSSAGIAGQYPLDYHGKPWDISWPEGQMFHQTRVRTWYQQPVTFPLLRLMYERAKKQGYKIGESVFGGACFISEACVKKLNRSFLLGNTLFKKVNLEEDHLFSLFAKATGFQLCDLSGNEGPFACAWKGLPASPQELSDKKKKIIHSVRYWDNMTEDQIRNFFRLKRYSNSQQQRA